MATDGEQHDVSRERIVDVHERLAIARIDEVSLEMVSLTRYVYTASVMYFIFVVLFSCMSFVLHE